MLRIPSSLWDDFLEATFAADYPAGLGVMKAHCRTMPSKSELFRLARGRKSIGCCHWLCLNMGLPWDDSHAMILGAEESEALSIVTGSRADVADEFGRSHLYYAVLRNSIALVRALMQNWPLPQSEVDRSIYWCAVYNSSLDVVQQLDSRADWSNLGRKLWTVVRKSEPAVLEYLLRIRSVRDHINDVDSFGYSLLHTAVDRDNPEIVSIILRNGADPNATAGLWVQTPMDMIRSNCIGRLLIDGGALPSFWNYCRVAMVREVRELLIDEPRLATRPSPSGSFPMHYACVSGSTNCIHYLLDHGATFSVDVGIVGRPEHSACRADQFVIIQEFGCDPFVRSQNGDTLLHAACRGGAVLSTRALLGEGLDLSARGIDGETPLEIASERSSEIVNIILSQCEERFSSELLAKCFRDAVNCGNISAAIEIIRNA
ncbi:MAG: ankyrin repeat domain-containing protein [Caldilineaceae bacterium]|nr:ankyrin repeat domain-containing protein [Caldilineaceae bacterium]MCB9842506.1 ankyrin repeat domain-containing protein [Phycisphaeraceae bacterium]